MFYEAGSPAKNLPSEKWAADAEASNSSNSGTGDEKAATGGNWETKASHDPTRDWEVGRGGFCSDKEIDANGN